MMLTIVKSFAITVIQLWLRQAKRRIELETGDPLLIQSLLLLTNLVAGYL